MLRVYPGKLNGTLQAPTSAIHAQRLLFVSALADRPTRICNIPYSDSIETTMAALDALGCGIDFDGNDIIVTPFNKQEPKEKLYFDFEDSDFTAKASMAVCGALGFSAACSGSSRLQKKRLVSYTGKLALRGLVFSSFSLPCEISGRLLAGEYSFDGERPALDASAAIIALPLLPTGSKVLLSEKLQNSEQLHYTIKAMQSFGIAIRQVGNLLLIPGNQSYKSPDTVSVETDFTLAAPWLVAGASAGNKGSTVMLTGVTSETMPALSQVQQKVSVLEYDFSSISMDFSDCPELAPIVAIMSMLQGSTLMLTGISSLNEGNDLLSALTDISIRLGQYSKKTPDGDGIAVFGSGKPSYEPDTVLDALGDPLLFISLVLASSAADKPYIITGEEDLNKRYFSFLKIFEKLGGSCEYIADLSGENIEY